MLWVRVPPPELRTHPTRPVNLYVCYGTWTAGGAVHKHPCGEAHRVPALVTDEGGVVQGSRKIIAWAQSHPASVAIA